MTKLNLLCIIEIKFNQWSYGVLMTDEIRIPHRKLESIIRDTLASIGVPSHGIRMLPGLMRGIREGRATANPQIKILRERAATILIDGDNGPGRYVSVQAMQHAIDRAKKFGVGVCIATRVTHWGRAHAYAYRIGSHAMVRWICASQ